MSGCAGTASPSCFKAAVISQVRRNTDRTQKDGGSDSHGIVCSADIEIAARSARASALTRQSAAVQAGNRSERWAREGSAGRTWHQASNRKRDANSSTDVESFTSISTSFEVLVPLGLIVSIRRCCRSQPGCPSATYARQARFELEACLAQTMSARRHWRHWLLADAG